MELQKKTFNADKVWNILCTTLKYCGLWTPFDKKSWIQILYKIYGAISQIIFYVFFVTSLTVGLLGATKLQAVSSLLPMTVAQMAVMTKMIPIFFSNHRLQKIRENIESFKLLSVDEERFVDIHIRFYRKVVLMMSILPLLTIFFWGISSVSGTHRRVIFDAWLPGFDWENSDRDYWIVEIYQFSASVFASYYDITIDLYYCFAMYAVSVELKLLGERYSLMRTIHSFIFAKQLLIDHVKTLLLIRSSIKEIKYCIGTAYMMQVLMSVLCICSSINEMARVMNIIHEINMTIFNFKKCLHLFQTSIIVNPYYFISNLMGVSGFMFQIGICCYFGQDVFSAYNALSRKLYESNWPELLQDRDCSRTILFMMEDLKKDCVIFIGKTMPMLLTTFTSVSCKIIQIYAF